MKVLHIISSGGYYGAEAMLLNLIAAQRRAGVDASLLAFDNLGQSHLEVVEKARQRGLPAEIVGCRGRFDRRLIGNLARMVREGKFSILHSHGYKSNFYASLAARRTHTPFVVTSHLWTGSNLAIRVYEALDAGVLRGANHVVGVSDDIVACLRKSGIPAGRTSVVYNGVETAHRSGVRPSLRGELRIGAAPLIGTVGRLEGQKGLQYYIEAAEAVLHQLSEAMFVIVGDGSLRSELAQSIRSRGLEKKVLLLGQRNDMPEVYASLDLFVLASVSEGMPMVLLEALSASLPVVATRVGAVAKLIRPDETGLLVEPRSVSELSGAILQCLRDPARARQFGRNGQALVRAEFSADAMAARYIGMYEGVLASRPSRRHSALVEA